MVVVESLSSVGQLPVRTRAMVPMITALMQGAGRTAAAVAGASSTPSAATSSGPACRTALLVDCGEFGEDGSRALRNAAGMVSGVEVMSVDDLTVYHILKFNVLIISKPALGRLSKQLAFPSHRNKMPAKRKWWARELKEFQKATEELGCLDELRPQPSPKLL